MASRRKLTLRQRVIGQVRRLNHLVVAALVVHYGERKPKPRRKASQRPVAAPAASIPARTPAPVRRRAQTLSDVTAEVPLAVASTPWDTPTPGRRFEPLPR